MKVRSDSIAATSGRGLYSASRPRPLVAALCLGDRDHWSRLCAFGQRLEYRGMAKEPIGLIGVGLLGTALAERMLAAGFRVAGFDCDVARREALVALGGEAGESSRAIAAGCRRIVLCLPDSSVVAAVVQEIEAD